MYTCVISTGTIFSYELEQVATPIEVQLNIAQTIVRGQRSHVAITHSVVIFSRKEVFEVN